MKKVAVVINPVAGKGKTIKLLPQIKEEFKKYQHLIEVSYYVSKNQGDISTITRECVKKNITNFVSIGGDGTLSEIVNGLTFDEKAAYTLTIVPAGTGNDFVKSAGITHKSMKEIIKNLVDDNKRVIDIGCVNGFYFINTCTFGIDGPIVVDTEKFKKILPGQMAYLFSTIKRGITFKPQSINLVVDEKRMSCDALLISIGNGKYAGGGMKLCPEAEIDDGILDLSIVTKVSILKFMKELRKVYDGTFVDLEEVKTYKGKEMLLEVFPVPYFINADGNIIGHTPARVNIIPKALYITN